MGYIAPSTTITFYRDTGLSPNYDNTLYFTTEADKNSYFNTWSSTNNRIVAVANNSYQRANRNYVRVNINISLLYDCDYMRFVNANYENKIFYAFVMNVNYINNNTTEVEYQIDYLMTWMGNFYCRPCWIERQTPATDVIGANKIGEPIGVNGYVEEGTEYSDDWGQSNSTIRIQYADPDEAQATKWGGIYNPTKFIDSDDASTIANTIGNLVQQDLVDNIVNIYMVPKDFENPGSVNEKSVSVTKPVFTIDGYTPKNKKLLLFPYKYLLVDNSEGNQKTFYYEYFSDDKCNFTIYGTSVNSVEIDLIPNNYLGHVGMDFTNKLVMSHFPIRKIKASKKASKDAKEMTDIDYERISFGLSILLNKVEETLLIGVFFAIRGSLKELIISMIVLKAIRLYAGGIHMKKEYQCFIVTFIYFYSVIFVSEKIYLSSELSIILQAFSYMAVLIHTPIESRLRHITDKKKIILLKIKVTISFILIWISEIILMKYSNLISWSLILILVENIAYECIKLFRDVKKKEATYEKDL